VDASERVLRTHAQAALLLVTEDTRQNFNILREVVSIAGDLEGYDQEKLRNAGAHLIDAIEDCIMSIETYVNDPRLAEVAQSFKKMREELAAA
jgi:hypothetical protein